MNGRRKPKQRRALGSVFQRSDGKWAAEIELGIIDGKRRRLTRYAKTEREAEQKLADMIAESGRGALQAPSTTTMKEWLDGYLARKHKARASKPATVREDRRLVGLITGHLGTRRLTALHGAHVQALMHDHAKYSPRTRRKMLTLLTSALEEATALSLIARNPAKAVTLPRLAAAPPQHKVWSKAQVRRFLAAVQGHRLASLYRLLLGQGLRLGEALALRLEHYHPEKSTLYIRQTIQRETAEATRRTAVGSPKTHASLRTLTLPADLNAELRDHLDRRKAEAEKTAAKGLWSEEGWLFPSETGTMLGDRNVARHLDETIARLNKVEVKAAAEAVPTREPDLLPRLTPHGLRYTFINLAIRAGAPFDVVSAIVGHSSPVITMKIYRQIQQEELQEVGASLIGLLD
ncbi:tyrosine-type recombinase/integrase [Deinococcus sp. HMF7620]|uniref:Tyrosine-type recombinase/integrase n=1 Tax=Deinococcus arboris TaxID=2682977 RepID=A0A7C9LQU1_9DEIO|nr:tyrosine-type recombinase/integrase [Deinococcus arboris]MVN86861.1 tyrosine-type recombinase/integrase [Deinococcus arboris]